MVHLPILEAEFIVVTDMGLETLVFDHYLEYNTNFYFWISIRTDRVVRVRCVIHCMQVSGGLNINGGELGEGRILGLVKSWWLQFSHSPCVFPGNRGAVIKIKLRYNNAAKATIVIYGMLVNRVPEHGEIICSTCQCPWCEHYRHYRF